MFTNPERITRYTSITAFNPRFSGIYGSMADDPLTIRKCYGVNVDQLIFENRLWNNWARVEGRL